MDSEEGVVANTENEGPSPSRTLYVKNLNDRLKKHELKTSLYFLFSQYGEILDIITNSTAKMRGQAFVVFQLLENAELAQKKLNNFEMFDKKMIIEFSRTVSDAVAIEQGTYQFKDHQKIAQIATESKKRRQEQIRLLQQGIGTADESTNNVLFVEDLPAQVTEELLSELFSQFPGFCALKLVGEKRLAVVEFEDDSQATVALKGLNGYKMTEDNALKIKYAKLG